MATPTPDTNELLQKVVEGDQHSVDELLIRHRHRLRRMVAVRMDARLQRRCDASDVVQEALIEAARKLPVYAKARPLPFYPWLRRIAWERMVDLHRRHFALQRKVTLEEHWQPNHETVTTLAGRLVGRRTGPDGSAIREELRRRVREALTKLSETDRDVLLMRYAEQLRVHEIASLLDLTEPAVKSRVRRALERLNQNLSDHLGEHSL